MNPHSRSGRASPEVFLDLKEAQDRNVLLEQPLNRVPAAYTRLPLQTRCALRVAKYEAGGNLAH